MIPEGAKAAGQYKMSEELFAFVTSPKPEERKAEAEKDPLLRALQLLEEEDDLLTEQGRLAGRLKEIEADLQKIARAKALVAELQRLVAE